jgi:ferredoxin
VRITIDPNRCTGHAKCWGALPQIYELDDEGFATVTVDEVPTELEDQVRLTVNNCPERAISIEQ